MDLEVLKPKLGDETFAELAAYIQDLSQRRDEAVQKSEEGRQKFKRVADERDALRTVRNALYEKLGLDDDADIDSLPLATNQAEAAKQYEAKVKRLERELTERQQQVEEIGTRYRSSQQEAALRQALGGHDWIDQDLVASFAGARLVWEDDQVLYKTDGGALVPLADGVQTLAKARPHLLKSSGAGGSGYRGTPGNGGAASSLSRAQFDALSPTDRMTHIKAGGSLTD